MADVVNHNYKYVFWGTPEFAAIILEKLINAGYIPAAVVCNPDRPAGRKKIITPPPTKILAQKYNIPVLQPEVLSNSKFEALNSKPDFAIVAAYAKILPKEIFSMPRFGTIGIHPSLLPRHRGTTPIQSAILAGDKITGVTLYLFDEKFDHGPILASRELTITNNDNYNSLTRKLAELGGELLVSMLRGRTSNGNAANIWEIRPQPQNEEYATYTKKFQTEDAFVNLKEDNPVMIERKIRALNPEPGVWTYLKTLRQYYGEELPKPITSIWGGPAAENKRLKILEAELKEGKLILKKIQVEGRKPQVLRLVL